MERRGELIDASGFTRAKRHPRESKAQRAQARISPAISTEAGRWAPSFRVLDWRERGDAGEREAGFRDSPAGTTPELAAGAATQTAGEARRGAVDGHCCIVGIDRQAEKEKAISKICERL